MPPDDNTLERERARVFALVEGSEAQLIRQLMGGWRGLVSMADAECLVERTSVEVWETLKARVSQDGLSWRDINSRTVLPLARCVLQRRTIDLVIRRRLSRVAVSPPPGWDEPSDEADPSDEVITRAVHQRLRDLMLGEPEVRRAFLHLVLIEDWSQAEACEMLRINENTGRAWHRRFLQRCERTLRRWIEP